MLEESEPAVGVAVPAISTFGIKKRMKVHVVVDNTLEGIIYKYSTVKVARSD